MRRLALIATAVTLVVAMSPLASATVHGRNGRIAFRQYLNNAQTHGAIFTINPDGTGLRQVTHPGRGKISSEPDWSPNGRWIAYHVGKSESFTRVVKIRPDGSDRTRVSRCTGPPKCLSDGYPAWAPQGKRIAVERELCSTGRNNLVTIYIMRADGTHARRVTQKHATCSGSHRYASNAPQWAPDGDRLAFERIDNVRERHAIFTVRLDGTGLRRLTPWRMDAAQPDWSPNHRWIAFRTKEQSDTRGNIALVHPNGTGLHAITHGGNKFKWLSCSFSPNGKKITAARVPGDGATANADVYTMKLNGSQRRNVTNSADAWESAPDWGSRH
jgi:TolB protein